MQTGVAAVPAELSRYALNSVIRGEYDVPPRVASFIHELFAGYNYKFSNILKTFRVPVVEPQKRVTS